MNKTLAEKVRITMKRYTRRYPPVSAPDPDYWDKLREAMLNRNYTF